MKKLKRICMYAAIILNLTPVFLHAQDLIITTGGDSVNCKIINIKNDNIYYEFKHNREVRNTLIPSSIVRQYQYNYFQPGTSAITTASYIKDYPKNRLAVSGGYSYRIAKIYDDIPGALKNHLKEMKSGRSFGMDISHYFFESLGTGFKFNVFNSASSMDDVHATLIDGTNIYGTIGDKVSILFIGPFFSTRLLDRYAENSLIFNVGIGYLAYKEVINCNEEYILKGNTLGVCLDAGYDIMLTRFLNLGLQFSYNTGTLTKFRFSRGYGFQTIKLEEDRYEGLARLDLSIGLRFKL